MSYPQNLQELRAAGYVMSEGRDGTNNGVCNRCGADIEWWKSPAGKSLPFDPMRSDKDKAQLHFKTCTG